MLPAEQLGDLVPLKSMAAQKVPGFQPKIAPAKQFQGPAIVGGFRTMNVESESERFKY